MAACTFFGHRDCPDSVKHKLLAAIENLIAEKHVTSFYVGNHGNFDRLAASLLRDLAALHPDIKYYVVLAYLPTKAYSESYESIFPEGIEDVPKRFAIDFRNRWMIDKSDYVITYVTRSFGGAAKSKNYAEKHGKHMIEVSSPTSKNL